MGCDYYISKHVIINIKNNFPLYIELERDYGYFHFYKDEDDPNYDKEYKLYVNEILTPKMEPIIIYEKDKFLNSKLENKYIILIQEKLDYFNNCHDDKIDWKDIIDIKKIETRYERD
jgi:hypothetical protein